MQEPASFHEGKAVYISEPRCNNGGISKVVSFISPSI